MPPLTTRCSEPLTHLLIQRKTSTVLEKLNKYFCHIWMQEVWLFPAHALKMLEGSRGGTAPICSPAEFHPQDKEPPGPIG
jgi:hypothetical protein